jgi:hypothetical protein
MTLLSSGRHQSHDHDRRDPGWALPGGSAAPVDPASVAREVRGLRTGCAGHCAGWPATPARWCEGPMSWAVNRPLGCGFPSRTGRWAAASTPRTLLAAPVWPGELGAAAVAGSAGVCGIAAYRGRTGRARKFFLVDFCCAESEVGGFSAVAVHRRKPCCAGQCGDELAVTGTGSADLTETALLPNVSPAPRDTEHRWWIGPLDQPEASKTACGTEPGHGWSRTAGKLRLAASWQAIEDLAARDLTGLELAGKLEGLPRNPARAERWCASAP